LNVDAFSKALYIAIINDLAFLTLKKGAIKRFPTILIIYLSLLVRHVGLICEFNTKSYSYKPICLINQVLTKLNYFPSGNPINGDVNIIPERFK
jgi:hypothetical protein